MADLADRQFTTETLSRVLEELAGRQLRPLPIASINNHGLHSRECKP
jgi:hypothetical protein